MNYGDLIADLMLCVTVAHENHSKCRPLGLVKYHMPPDTAPAVYPFQDGLSLCMASLRESSPSLGGFQFARGATRSLPSDGVPMSQCRLASIASLVFCDHILPARSCHGGE